MSVALTIAIDTREQTPWLFEGFGVETKRRTLAEGDYTIVSPDLSDRVAIERKSGSDLYGCMTTGRDRFQRELERLRRYEFSAVVVEATEQDLLSGMFGRMTPRSVKATLIAWQTRYPTQWSFNPCRSWAERTAFLMLERFARDVAAGKRPGAKEGVA